MLAYRHLFHAGGFSDVFKHALLARLMLHLNKKDKPYLYLDTHAGIGQYDLQHDWPQKTKEFENGITKILGAHRNAAVSSTGASRPTRCSSCRPSRTSSP